MHDMTPDEIEALRADLPELCFGLDPAFEVPFTSPEEAGGRCSSVLESSKEKDERLGPISLGP